MDFAKLFHPKAELYNSRSNPDYTKGRYSMAAEKELLHGIALMKEGKEEGFNILYSHTYNYVYGRARSIMKTESDAQDLTQETFIQAYKGIASLEDANNIYAWLGGIVFRQGAKLYNKTKQELLLNEDQDYIFDEVETKDVDALPEESAELKATTDVVMGMIDELPELQRSAIVSFYYDHMKIEEIAKVFGCSVNTIKSRLNYAKKFLKSKVEEHQKQYRYKLFSFSPAVLLLALRGLLTSEKYTMAPESAEKVYHVACDALGITSSTVAVGAVGVAAASVTGAGSTGAAGAATGTAVTAGATAIEGAAISATATASAAGTATTVATAAKAGGLIGKFLAISTAAKTGTVVLATAIIGGGATTAVLVSNNNPEPPAIVQEVVIDEPEATMTPVPTVTIAPTATLFPEPTATPIPTSTPESTKVPTHTHDYTYKHSVVTSPTCSEIGTVEETCSCGEVRIVELPITDCVYETFTERTTCTETVTTKCIFCKTILAEETLPDTHVEGEWETIIEATCTHEGTRQKRCLVSGCDTILLTESVPTNDNHPFVWDTNGDTRTQICSECGTHGLTEYRYGDIWGYYDDTAANELWAMINERRATEQVAILDDWGNVTGVKNRDAFLYDSSLAEKAKARAIEAAAIDDSGANSSDECLAVCRVETDNLRWFYTSGNEYVLRQSEHLYGGVAFFRYDPDNSGKDLISYAILELGN